MSILNERAHELCQAIVADADKLGVDVGALQCGTRVIDCGVKAPGGIEAGRRLAEVCLAGFGDVFVSPSSKIPNASHEVSVATKMPVAACMASQYAGWEIKGDKFFAMGSGPMRAAACREDLFKEIGNCEKPDVCVGVLETSKLPPESVCADIAQKCNVSLYKLTLLVARTSSLAGTVQIVARSVETALHKLHTLGFDLSRVVSGMGRAPLPPPSTDDLTAIGRTNDAILYGGYVVLSIRGDDKTIEQIGPNIPSVSSNDYGRPFSEVFARYNNDFYRIDPLLFSPGYIAFVNVDTGTRHEFGRLAPEVLAESFAIK